MKDKTETSSANNIEPRVNNPDTKNENEDNERYAHKKRNITNKRSIDRDRDTTSTIPDHSSKVSDQACIVYKFQSRPPYEGFVLILVIVIIAVLLIWWLNSKLKASDQ